MSHLPPIALRTSGRPSRDASHRDRGGDLLRQLRRRGRDTALASSGEPGRAAHELSDRLTAKTERADASIRQDLYEAAWRRLQPLRCSSPRGRPRSSYSATEPTTRPGRSRRAAAGSLRRQVSTKGRERPAARARPTGPQGAPRGRKRNGPLSDGALVAAGSSTYRGNARSSRSPMLRICSTMASTTRSRSTPVFSRIGM